MLSSDTCRALVSDDELDQSATTDAFDVLHYIAAKRLERGKLVVVDATNVQPEARKMLVNLAKSQNVLATAIVFNVPERVCLDRNAQRVDRVVPPHAIARQIQDLRRHGARDIAKEGFRYTFTVTLDDMDTVRIERTKLWSDKRDEHGPFDIIGDVHGCVHELRALLARLGYAPNDAASGAYAHPEGRKAFFVGDLTDRGPGSVETLDLARAMVDRGTAFAVPGNHDEKLSRWLGGKRVGITHGLDQTVAEIDAIPAEQRRDWRENTYKFLDGLVSHAVLDDGNLVVAHAGLIEKMHGRSSGAVRSFALYGDTSGEIDADGLPIRRDWAADYRGRAAVIYGHTPVAQPHWVNNTLNIDTGCVFGGSLTALRWPERELVSVPAEQTYAEPARPFLPGPGAGKPGDASKFVSPTDLMLADVYEGSPIGVPGDTFGGKRRVETKLAGSVTIAPENGAAALEVMSRFGVDPRWMAYLPPTMSPCETEPEGEPYLEHPRGAFNYYSRQGVSEIICEEKHMGSRAVIAICRDAEAAHRRFNVPESMGLGECYTRTGRRFFDGTTRTAFLARVKAALDAAEFWNEHATDWALIDSEILPWNAKAQGLLRDQYAPVGAAANASLTAAHRLINAAHQRGVGIDAGDIAQREDAIHKYIDAYRAYCWPVDGLTGLQIAPFQPARHRRRGPHRQRPSLAPGRSRQAGRSRPDPLQSHRSPNRQPRR